MGVTKGMPAAAHETWAQHVTAPSRRRSARWDDSGAVIGEFIASFTLLFSMLFGVMAFGRALYTYHYVCDAAQQGARYAIVHGSNSGSPVTSDMVQSYLRVTTPGLTSTSLNVTATWNPNNNAGSAVTVQVSYTYQYLFPFLPTSTTMSATSKMNISQ